MEEALTGAMETGGAQVAPPTAFPSAPTAVHVGTPTPANLSPLGRKLAEHRTLAGAGVSSKVKETGWGYEELPPTKPSRKKQALIGLLQGAMIGGATGDPWKALGAAGTGAVAGAISPTLMQAFTRQQELDAQENSIKGMQEVEFNQARIAETQAQAQQRAAQPQMEVYTDPQSGEQYTLKSGEAARLAQRDRERAAKAAEEKDRYVDYVPPDAPPGTKARRIKESEAARLDEDYTQHQRRPPAAKPDRVINNQIWRPDADGIYHLAPGSPPPKTQRDIAAEKEGERSTERAAKGKQAAALFQKGHDYWKQAKAKRAEAAALPRSTPQRDDRITQLLREAIGLENKTREVQIKGDLLAAEAEAGPTASRSGRTIEGAIAAFKSAQKRDPTPDEIERMRAALNR